MKRNKAIPVRSAGMIIWYFWDNKVVELAGVWLQTVLYWSHLVRSLFLAATQLPTWTCLTRHHGSKRFLRNSEHSPRKTVVTVDRIPFTILSYSPCIFGMSASNWIYLRLTETQNALSDPCNWFLFLKDILVPFLSSWTWISLRWTVRIGAVGVITCFAYYASLRSRLFCLWLNHACWKGCCAVLTRRFS